MHLQPPDIFQQPLEIAELGVAAEKIMFIVIFEIIDDRVLLYGFRVAAREFKQLRVGDAGQDGEQTARGGEMRRKTAFEENAFLAHRIKEWRGVEGVAAHAAFIHAERFALHQHDIGTAFQRATARGRHPPVGKIIFIGQLHPFGHHGKGLPGLLFIEIGFAQFQGGEKILQGVNGEVGLKSVPEPETVVTAQRHP